MFYATDNNICLASPYESEWAEKKWSHASCEKYAKILIKIGNKKKNNI